MSIFGRKMGKIMCTKKKNPFVLRHYYSGNDYLLGDTTLDNKRSPPQRKTHVVRAKNLYLLYPSI